MLELPAASNARPLMARPFPLHSWGFESHLVVKRSSLNCSERESHRFEISLDKENGVESLKFNLGIALRVRGLLA